MSEQHNQALGLMSVVLVLARTKVGGVWARNRLHKKNPDGLIPNRVIDYTPRMVTQKFVFRINCVMIPDSMGVVGYRVEVRKPIGLLDRITYLDVDVQSRSRIWSTIASF